jgi:hypothetical protein
VEVLILQAFVSLMLVGGAVLLFTVSWRQRDHEHADRLALLPAEDDEVTRPHDARLRDEPAERVDGRESNGDRNGNPI